MPKKNLRNYKHGWSSSATYRCWIELKRSRGGVCLSWKYDFLQFIADIGFRPSSRHWLFRTRGYQRSCKHNVKWSKYKRQPQRIWLYLTLDEIASCKKHIALVCKRGGYDLDVGINELYLYNLKGVKNPVQRIHSWIKRYLPKTLAVLKKRRGETIYNDEVKYEH